jgi:hypothetical protein
VEEEKGKIVKFEYCQKIGTNYRNTAIFRAKSLQQGHVKTAQMEVKFN